jgi:membrane protease YdiL (CAAX protease family)
MSEIVPKISIGIMLLVVGLILAFLGSLLITSLLLTSSEYDYTFTIKLGMLVGELLLPVPILIWTVKNRSGLLKTVRMNSVSRKTISSAILVGAGITIIADELDRISGSLFSIPDDFFVELKTLMSITDITSFVYVTGLVVIIAPLIEEMVFRGFFQRILEYHFKNTRIAILISALTFAVFHFNPWWALQILLIGIILGYVAWKTGSIVASFILHAINNAAAVWFINQQEKSLEWYEMNGHVSPFILIIGAVLFYSGIKLLIKTGNNSERRSKYNLYNSQ